jgi:hypothetical protein
LDGGIQQVVATSPGKRYTLRFDLAGNPEGGPRVQRLRVLIDQKAHEFEFDSTGKSKTDLGWVTKEVAFTAERDRVVLTFLNTQPNAQSAGVALDNIEVRARGEKAANQVQELYLRMRRFEREAEDLRRAGRDAEAAEHAAAAARYRLQFEKLIGLPVSEQ